MIPKYNDLVTVLVDGLLVHGRWGGDGGSSFACPGTIEPLYTINRRGIAGIVATSRVTLSDEGKTWVRGHVTENDRTGAALLTVYALRARHIDPRAYDPADLEDLFFHG